MTAQIAPESYRSTRFATAASVPRLLLVLGALATLLASLLLSSNLSRAVVEPELALLLRFMAGVKGGLALLALGLVAWRFGRQTSPGLIAVYCLGVWGMCASAVLVWTLTHLGLGVGSFHLWAIMLLLAAAVDGRRADRRSKARHPGARLASR